MINQNTFDVDFESEIWVLSCGHDRVKDLKRS